MRTVLLCNPNTVLKEKEIGLNEREKNNVKKIILHYCSMVVVAAASMSVQGQSWSSRARQCKGSRGRREHVSARAVVATASTSVQGQSWPPRARQCKDIRGCREHVSARAVVTTASMSVQGQSWLSRARECKGSRGHRKHVSARAVVTASSMSVEDSCGCCEYVSARVVVVAVNTPA